MTKILIGLFNFVVYGIADFIVGRKPLGVAKMFFHFAIFPLLIILSGLISDSLDLGAIIPIVLWLIYGCWILFDGIKTLSKEVNPQAKIQ